MGLRFGRDVVQKCLGNRCGFNSVSIHIFELSVVVDIQSVTKVLHFPGIRFVRELLPDYYFHRFAVYLLP